MRFKDLYSKIISKEPYNDMDIFFANYENFEEIPLVSRYSRLKCLEEEMSSDGVSDFLTGFAAFLLSTLRLLDASRGNDVFFAITFTDFEGGEEQGVLVPNIFIYPKPASVGFLEKIRESHSGLASQEIKEIKRHFSNCGLETAFDFYESRFHDAACGEEIVRVFAVFKDHNSPPIHTKNKN
ncbi:Imm15 family immunity protein [Pseudomonas allokribbensis]|uniref:Imm15 family immunity protein n=1 Tax=Pseudomonas allokribbensis TaxID=2774460 RepID=UPI0017885418|nr:Imm15 family immunity protein [Pseudomonas allokribbensis]